MPWTSKAGAEYEREPIRTQPIETGRAATNCASFQQLLGAPSRSSRDRVGIPIFDFTRRPSRHCCAAVTRLGIGFKMRTSRAVPRPSPSASNCCLRDFATRLIAFWTARSVRLAILISRSATGDALRDCKWGRLRSRCLHRMYLGRGIRKATSYSADVACDKPKPGGGISAGSVCQPAGADAGRDRSERNLLLGGRAAPIQVPNSALGPRHRKNGASLRNIMRTTPKQRHVGDSTFAWTVLLTLMWRLRS